MSVQFFQTRMGRQFYEATMPELVKQLQRLNELLERIAAAHERQAQLSGEGYPPEPHT